MKKILLMSLITMFSGISFIYGGDVQKIDLNILQGTWSYEKTESNMTGKGITLKVYQEWLITFNANGSYVEKSRLGDKNNPEVKGTYQVKGDLISRSKNKVLMKVLVLNEKELVITSAKNTKIFFIKK